MIVFHLQKSQKYARDYVHPWRRPNHATAESLPSSSAIPMPITGSVAPTKMAVMPVIEKPPETVANAKAAVRVATVTPVLPLRNGTVGMSLPSCGGGLGWTIAAGTVTAAAGAPLMACAVTIDLRLLRNLACRWAAGRILCLGPQRSDVVRHRRPPHFQKLLKRVADNSE
jgi:hypothetical protein